MASTQQLHQATGSVSIDIPSTRNYSSQADAELDRKLVSAIDTAEEAGNESLAQLIRYELGSHYHSLHA